jgi:hypothetical protein
MPTLSGSDAQPTPHGNLSRGPWPSQRLRVKAMMQPKQGDPGRASAGPLPTKAASTQEGPRQVSDPRPEATGSEPSPGPGRHNANTQIAVPKPSQPGATPPRHSDGHRPGQSRAGPNPHKPVPSEHPHGLENVVAQQGRALRNPPELAKSARALAALARQCESTRNCTNLHGFGVFEIRPSLGCPWRAGANLDESKRIYANLHEHMHASVRICAGAGGARTCEISPCWCQANPHESARINAARGWVALASQGESQSNCANLLRIYVNLCRGGPGPHVRNPPESRPPQARADLHEPAGICPSLREPAPRRAGPVLAKSAQVWRPSQAKADPTARIYTEAGRARVCEIRPSFGHSTPPKVHLCESARIQAEAGRACACELRPSLGHPGEPSRIYTNLCAST